MVIGPVTAMPQVPAYFLRARFCIWRAGPVSDFLRRIHRREKLLVLLEKVVERLPKDRTGIPAAAHRLIVRVVTPSAPTVEIYGSLKSKRPEQLSPGLKSRCDKQHRKRADTLWEVYTILQ